MYIYAKDTTPPSNRGGRYSYDFQRRFEETSKPEEAAEVLGRMLIGATVDEITAALRSIYDKADHDYTGRVSRVSNALALYGAVTHTWLVYQTPRYVGSDPSMEGEACKCWAMQHAGRTVQVGYRKVPSPGGAIVATKHKTVIDGAFILDDEEDVLVYDPVKASKCVCRAARKTSRKLAPWEQKPGAVVRFQASINRICSSLAVQVCDANAWCTLFTHKSAPYINETPETGRTAPRLTYSIRYLADALKYLRPGKAKGPAGVCRELLDSFGPFTLWMAHRAKGNNGDKALFENWATLSKSPEMLSILRWAKRIVREDAKAAKAAEETEEN